MKPRSKLQPFPRGEGLQKAWFGMRPGVGSPHPGLSSSSQPSSLPNPTTMMEPLPSQSPLPGAPLSQLMTPSLQRLQRETEALGSTHQSLQGPETPSHRTQVIAGFGQTSHCCLWLPVQRGRVSLQGKFHTAAFSLVSNFHLKTGIITPLSRKLTSGPESGRRCLQGDNPFLGSGRSTGSYKSRERRKVSRLRSQGACPAVSQGHPPPTSVLIAQCLYRTGG